ncbi:hypothetical protein COLO4_30827 [Corchorus olitorius]|uniref:Uncharacterized protein n=1 Tax=Corchorus olitorius TaxID=93759 RepID=A0A1R3H714_9ROSI|nr:hypothetical protein COLO4_30827 [Corchorus olitorius]
MGRYGPAGLASFVGKFNYGLEQWAPGSMNGIGTQSKAQGQGATARV